MKNKNNSFWFGVIFALMLGIASWSLYNLANQGATDLLANFGISNFYLQNGLIVLVVFIVLLISGKSIKKAMKNLI